MMLNKIHLLTLLADQDKQMKRKKKEKNDVHHILQHIHL